MADARTGKRCSSGVGNPIFHNRKVRLIEFKSVCGKMFLPSQSKNINQRHAFAESVFLYLHKFSPLFSFGFLLTRSQKVVQMAFIENDSPSNPKMRNFFVR